MANRAMVIKGLECCKWSRQNVQPEKNRCDECPYKDQGIMNAFTVWRSCTNVLADDALALLKEQEEIKEQFEEIREQFIEAFKTIRNAYNVPANREKILLNYLLRIAGCCEKITD